MGWLLVCVHHFSPRVENVSVCLPHNRSGSIEFLRKRGIPCSLYIDDRLNGELLTKSGPWSILYSERREEFRVKAATVAIFIVLSVLVEIGIVLYPTTSLEYLGFLVDSVKQAFVIPQRKIVSWASLREKILACKKSVDIKSLQRFQGKCIFVVGYTGCEVVYKGDESCNRVRFVQWAGSPLSGLEI